MKRIQSILPGLLIAFACIFLSVPSAKAAGICYYVEYTTSNASGKATATLAELGPLKSNQVRAYFEEISRINNEIATHSHKETPSPYGVVVSMNLNVKLCPNKKK